MTHEIICYDCEFGRFVDAEPAAVAKEIDHFADTGHDVEIREL